MLALVHKEAIDFGRSNLYRELVLLLVTSRCQMTEHNRSIKDIDLNKVFSKEQVECEKQFRE